MDFSSGVLSHVKSTVQNMQNSGAKSDPKTPQSPVISNPSEVVVDSALSPAKSNDYSDVLVVNANENQTIKYQTADKNIDYEPEKEPKLSQQNLSPASNVTVPASM